MSTWYKKKPKLSHENNRSKMRVLQHSIIGIIEPYNSPDSMVPRYANVVIKILKLYMNCGMTAMIMAGSYYSTATCVLNILFMTYMQLDEPL